jgi:hypothetical protein
MDWTQTILIIGINIALIGALAILIVRLTNKLDNNIKLINSKLDKQITFLNIHTKRIDQLYIMYCDAQKELSYISKESANRFYTLLQEINKK